MPISPYFLMPSPQSPAARTIAVPPIVAPAPPPTIVNKSAAPILPSVWQLFHRSRQPGNGSQN